MVACKSIKEKSFPKVASDDIVVIANDSLEYEIIIIDQGFQTYLNSVANPNGIIQKVIIILKINFT
jgi:hypothetical protein